MTIVSWCSTVSRVIALFWALSAFVHTAQAKVVYEGVSEGMPYQVEWLGSGLVVPWALEFLDKDTLLVNQKTGSVLRYDLRSKTKVALTGLPPIRVSGQGGLLDLAHYSGEDWYYFTYVEDSASGAVTSLARAKLRADRWESWTVLLKTRSGSHTGRHFGSRIAFDEQGYLYFSVGDRGVRSSAQAMDNHQGSIIRLYRDGRVPEDNPFVKNTQALPEIWSFGHRNPQGLAFDPATKRLWSIEHGPRGGDEINLIKRGTNYGWPVISYGKEYWGPKAVGEGTHKEGMEQPVKYFDPSIAPGSLLVYGGKAFPKWRGNLFSGALKLRHLNRVVVDADARFVREERLLGSLSQRIRSIEQSPEGWIYFATDRGNLYRIVPR